MQNVSGSTLPASAHDGVDAFSSAATPSETCGVVVSRVYGAAAVLAEVEALIEAGAACGMFQRPQWLAAAIELGRERAGAEPVLVILRNARSGEFVAALPLAVYRQGGLKTAGFIDFGVGDYGAPLLGRSDQSQQFAGDRLLKAIASALPGVDLLRLEKMPDEVGGVRNLLATASAARSSRFHANRLEVEGSVEAFVASRGKKYRKEAERCWRRLNDLGEGRLVQATSAQEVDATYGLLERWQSQRHHDAGHDYGLDCPHMSRFYRDLAIRGLGDGFARIFTLYAGNEPIAALYGITSGRTFTLLRIADAGRAYSAVSPGRMIVLQAMRALVAEGVAEFDMGIGDYPFKRWIGCRSLPLVDIVQPLSARALPRVAWERARGWARQNEALRATIGRLRRRPMATIPVEQAAD